MAELNEDLLDDALNSISNAEACKSTKTPNIERDKDEKLNEIFESLKDNFSDDIMKSLSDVNVEETNELIESVLGELISKQILYEPFICLKSKIEKEVEKGCLENQKGLSLINEILSLMDESEMGPNSSKSKERLMELIYELQEQGDLWSSLTDE